MEVTVAEPQRQRTAERVLSVWTRPTATDGSGASLLSELDEELQFLMTRRGPSMDADTTTDDMCCTFSNESNCCPTVALSVTHCCS